MLSRGFVSRPAIVAVVLSGQLALGVDRAVASPEQAGSTGVGHQVHWIGNTVPLLMEAGRDHTASITVRNAGDQPWRAGAVVAIYKWQAPETATAADFAALSLPTVLPVGLAPGQEFTFDRVRIRPPAQPGVYGLTFTLADGGRSFDGAAALALTVRVQPQGGAVSAAGYKVEWVSVDIPKQMTSGVDQTGRIAFRNTSPELWPAGTIHASYHWYHEGRMLPDLAPQTRIPFPIPPGQEAHVDKLLILPPRDPGVYQLQVTLVDQNAWFETKGADTVTVPVTVTPGHASVSSVISDAVTRRLQIVLWLVVGVVVAGAAIASRVAARLVHPLLTGAGVMALFLAALPVLSAPVQHLALQPFPDAPQYADAAHHLARGDGYVTTIHGDEPITPMHSPGFSVLLAPFAAVGDYPRSVQTAVQWFAVAYVFAAGAIAWYLAGPLAAVFVAAMLATSPFARISGTVVLSDLFAVLLVLCVVVLTTRLSSWRAFASGLLAGVLISVRLSMVVALIPLAFVVPHRHWTALAIGAAPPLVALALFQWVTWGSPLTTGYHVWVPDLQMFDVANALAPAPRVGQGNVWLFPDRLGGGLMQWVCPCPPAGPQAGLPNLWFYAATLSGAFWIFTPPLIPIIGLLYAWRRRQEPIARYALLVTVLTVALQTFYYSQEARFVAAPATLLGIYGAVAIARAFARTSEHAAEQRRAVVTAISPQALTAVRVRRNRDCSHRRAR